MFDDRYDIGWGGDDYLTRSSSLVPMGASDGTGSQILVRRRVPGTSLIVTHYADGSHSVEDASQGNGPQSTSEATSSGWTSAPPSTSGSMPSWMSLMKMDQTVAGPDSDRSANCQSSTATGASTSSAPVPLAQYK